MSDHEPMMPWEEQSNAYEQAADKKPFRVVEMVATEIAPGLYEVFLRQTAEYKAWLERKKAAKMAWLREPREYMTVAAGIAFLDRWAADINGPWGLEFAWV